MDEAPSEAETTTGLAHDDACSGIKHQSRLGYAALCAV